MPLSSSPVVQTASQPSEFASAVAALRAAGCVFAEDEARLLIEAAAGPAELAAMVGRRVAGLPLEHILGWVEFCGRRIAVEPGVFVPRRRTEFLAGLAAALVRPGMPVIDLCCGSGALGVAVCLAHAGIELHAVDIDPVAVQCARRNLGPLGGRVHVGDLYEPLPTMLQGRVGVLVANVPYVPTEQIRLLPPEARLHEARVALDGGVDGLDIMRRVIAAAKLWLQPGGRLLVEASGRQMDRVAEMFARAGFVPEVTTSEELDANVVMAGGPGPEK